MDRDDPGDDHRDVGATDPPGPTPVGREALDLEVELWALTPTRRVLHWAAIPLLLAIVAAGVHQLASHGLFTLAWLLVAVPLVLIVQQLRAVVAVWLDPNDGTLILFRAAAPALSVRVRQVRRLDRGAVANIWRYPGHDQRPVRIVTDHATATVSVFFPDPHDLAHALTDANPNTHVHL